VEKKSIYLISSSQRAGKIKDFKFIQTTVEERLHRPQKCVKVSVEAVTLVWREEGDGPKK
jgi:hypothetical protein